MIYKSEDLIRDVSNDTDFSPDIVESVYYGIFENLLFKIKHPNKHLAFNLRDFGTFLFRRKKLIETSELKMINFLLLLSIRNTLTIW